MSKLVITFVCENRHEVEAVTVDLNRTGDLTREEIWQRQIHIPDQVQGLIE